MRLVQQILTRNDCYKEGRHIAPAGVMIHSTGANNPAVARYVPGSEVLGENRFDNHWDRPGLDKCVHAFIGRFADGEVDVCQTLPWTMRGWHAGRGSRGTANDTHISVEVCEDGLQDPAYCRQGYHRAVELTAMLCRDHALDPLAPGVVICHAEGHQLGVASQHGDVLHWWPRHGLTMDMFRADVARAMEEGGDEDMTQEQFDQMMDNWLTRQADRAAAMPQLLEEAKAMGLTDGSRPRAFCTREEAAVMARAAVRAAREEDA